LRLVKQGITGTGSAATVKGGMIVTGAGLVFATAADRRVHAYDDATGTELTTLPLGGPTSGQPSMYELGGRQYLLVTASSEEAKPVTGAASAGPARADAPSVPPRGPAGIIAYALPSETAAAR
jgi:quinoprotein glucose dehydrogenase